MTRRMSLLTMAAAFTLAAGSPAARAQDQAKAADASGTWKWTVQFNERSFENTLKLKQEGSKLTGTISGPMGNETAIQEGKVQGDEVSFQVTRERNGNTIVQKYHGTLKGDTITGKVEMKFNDQTRERDWEAKKVSG